MARIFMDGFESGGLSLWDTQSGTINTLSGKTGSYCARTASGANPLVKSFSSVPYIYSAFKFNASGYASDVGIISFYGGGTSLGYLLIKNPTGLLNIGWGTSTLISQSSFPITTSIWYLVEIYYLPHLTNGTFTVKLNGVVAVTATGVKTAPSTTNVDAVYLQNISASSTYFDDFILDDANWIGPSSIQGLAVTGAGATTQFDPSAGNNYACVDEIPASDGDYVSTNVPNEIDTYACGDLTGTINSIKAVQVQARCMQEGSPAVPKIQLVTRPTSTDRVSASKSVQSYNPSTVANIWELNPDDSQSWESADVNGMEIGVKAVAS
jgi:hypothetical protein